MMKAGKLIIILLLLCVGKISAQQFEVRSFGLLQNDITAWINPIRDLNHEACALVKVPGGKNFTFTSPLGIVLRKEEIGETWLYIPHGSIVITIKHPILGVLRDYKFTGPLESRLSYEMVISLSPLPAQRLENSAVRSSQPKDDIARIIWMEKTTKKRPKEKLTVFALAKIDLSASLVSPGVMLGIVRRHGAYIHGSSNFISSASEWECNDSGTLTNGMDSPYYSNKKRISYYSCSTGGIHRIKKSLYLYEGMGYGSRKLIWKTNEGINVLNREHSYSGLTGELGIIWRTRVLIVSAGVLTVQGKYWITNAGVGFSF